MNPIRFIRREVFKVTQSDFAAMVGVAQATVSRWEGGVAPSLDDMQSIRAAAADRDIQWRDEWFFDPVNAGGVAGIFGPKPEAAE